MNADPISGTTLRWRYDDGPMRGKRFEHTFGADGTVSWREIDAQPSKTGDGTADSNDSTAKYEVAVVNPDVFVVSYLAASGFALTTVVDSKARTIVSFASNEKQLLVQRGALEGAIG